EGGEEGCEEDDGEGEARREVDRQSHQVDLEEDCEEGEAGGHQTAGLTAPRARQHHRRTYGERQRVRQWNLAMASFPLLFDLGSPKPTTRDIARTVKEGGAAALT